MAFKVVFLAHAPDARPFDTILRHSASAGFAVSVAALLGPASRLRCVQASAVGACPLGALLQLQVCSHPTSVSVRCLSTPRLGFEQARRRKRL